MDRQEFIASVLKNENVNFESIRERFDDTAIRTLHAVLGFAGEVAELNSCLNADEVDTLNEVEELGDLEWYLAVLADAKGASLAEVDNWAMSFRVGDTGVINHLIAVSGVMVDAAKREIFYGKPFGDWEVIISIASCTLMKYYVARGYTRHEVWVKNKEKLETRYKGKGFSEESAVNRDLEAEKESLS